MSEGGIEERLRRLEIGYTKISEQVSMMAGDVKDIKETLRELAYIAKQQVEHGVKITAFEESLRKVEEELANIKRFVYGAMALAAVGFPIGVEVVKHFLFR